MRRFVQCLVVFGVFTLISSAHVDAASNNLLIFQVQAGAVSGEVSASSQEFITIYNNGTQDINVTNWCVYNKAGEAFACLAPTVTNQTLYLPARGYMTIVSDVFSAQHNNYRADIIYSTTRTTITGSSDTITLKDAQKNEIDAISWSSSLTGGTVYQRQMVNDQMTMIDTDQLADFIKKQGVVLPVSSVYEVMTVVDECVNLPEIQAVIPAGYLKDEQGNCVLDACSNLEGLQVTIPEEFLREGANNCVFDYVKLRITELLPNAAGSDAGREYVEIYNPSDRDAFLVNYLLRIGDKTYNFPASLKLAPGRYMAFYNNEISFTLVNTNSSAVLLGDDGSVVDQSDAYNNPEDDMAWSLINETWQYTNQLTFATANIASIFEPEEVSASVNLQSCPAGQYRHPETRRCRLLVTTTSGVAACKDGQYRSEETNRCRTIALAGGTLTPCKENQYRSEETNRCRNIATATKTLTPCKDNQYRSEETNRCRNIVAAGPSTAAFAVEPIADNGTTFVGWWAMGSVAVIALAYAIWEWHREILASCRRFLSFFTQH